MSSLGGKKFKINPIVKKDLRIISRSMKFSWGLFAYEAILGIVFLFVLLIAFDEGYGYTRSYETLVALFPTLSGVQLGIIALILPVMTASSISGEKERQTFDLLLTTVMTPRQIIMGKLMSAVIRVMIFVFASIPLMAVSFTLGGLSWRNLFIMLIAAFVFAFFAGSVGMLASTIGKKTLSCIIIAFVIYFAFHQLSTIPSILIGIFAATGADWVISLLMVFNPVVAVIDMFVLMFSGEGLFDGFGSNLMGGYGGWIWVIISGAVIMGISFIMLEVAARRIDPLNGYAISKKKQEKMVTQFRQGAVAQYAQSPMGAAGAPNMGSMPMGAPGMQNNGPMPKMGPMQPGTPGAAPAGAGTGMPENAPIGMTGNVGNGNMNAMVAPMAGAGLSAGTPLFATEEEPELDFLKKKQQEAEPELDFLKEQQGGEPELDFLKSTNGEGGSGDAAGGDKKEG